MVLYQDSCAVRGVSLIDESFDWWKHKQESLGEQFMCYSSSLLLATESQERCHTQYRIGQTNQSMIDHRLIYWRGTGTERTFALVAVSPCFDLTFSAAVLLNLASCAGLA